MDNCSSSPVLLTHFILIFHDEGAYLVIHWKTVLASSIWTPVKKEGISSLERLKDVKGALSWRFRLLWLCMDGRGFTGSDDKVWSCYGII